MRTAKGPWMQAALAPGMLLGGLLSGYAARRTRLLPERLSAHLHLFNILALQANICWLTMWGVRWRWGMLRLPALGMTLSVGMTLVGLVVGRVHRFSRRDLITFALACGMSNLGSTGGLLVIRVLVSDVALQYGMIYLLYWTIYAFLFCFPLAKFGSGEGRLAGTGWRVVLGSLVDVRMLPLVGMGFGLWLGSFGPPRPMLAERVVYFLVLASAFVAMFAVGLALHLSKVRDFIPAYFTQAGVKFVVGPALAWLLLGLLGIRDPVLRRVVFVQASMSQAFYSVMFANLLRLNLHMANSMFLVNTLAFLVVVFPVLTVAL